MTSPGGDLEAFLHGIQPARRARDAGTVMELMREVTGLSPRLWSGTIVGFGEYHYRYASGREGDAPAASFSPRKANLVVYLPDGVGPYEDRLARLGPHTSSVGCLYMKDVGAIDLEVLREIVQESFRTVTSGVFGHRARESEDGRPGSGRV